MPSRQCEVEFFAACYQMMQAEALLESFAREHHGQRPDCMDDLVEWASTGGKVLQPAELWSAGERVTISQRIEDTVGAERRIRRAR